MAEQYHVVVKHNKLINNTRYNLSLQEQKIIMYLIAHIKPGDTELHTVLFSIQEFCKLLEIKEPKGHYKDLKRYTEGLLSKSFTIEDDKKLLTINWVEFVEVEKESGIIQLKLNHKLTPYLLDLRNNFTSYELYYILRFKSKYSIRLFEILKSAEYKRGFEMDINTIQNLLGSKYTRFVDFKRKVIEIAVKEINRETDLNVTVEYIKVGRAYKKIKFYIKNKYT